MSFPLRVLTLEDSSNTALRREAHQSMPKGRAMECFSVEHGWHGRMVMYILTFLSVDI